MGLFDKVLLTVDFDRTLTAPDSTIPERNLEAIRYFMENGGAFTVNTGRSVPMFRKYMELIPANAPFLLYNGSAAYDMAEKKLSLCKPIGRDMWEVLDAAAAAFPDMHLEIQGEDAHYSYWDRADWDAFYDGVGCVHEHAARDMVIEPFIKFSLFSEIREYTVAHLFHGSEEEFCRMDQVEQWLNETYGEEMEVFRAAPRIIDVHAKGVSKINAARALQKQLGRELLVCVGDAENDIPMLDGADYAFCPADAGVADRYENVCKCADGAVADVIYKKIPEILAIST